MADVSYVIVRALAHLLSLCHGKPHDLRPLKLIFRLSHDIAWQWKWIFKLQLLLNKEKYDAWVTVLAQNISVSCGIILIKIYIALRLWSLTVVRGCNRLILSPLSRVNYAGVQLSTTLRQWTFASATICPILVLWSVRPVSAVRTHHVRKPDDTSLLAYTCLKYNWSFNVQLFNALFQVMKI